MKFEIHQFKFKNVHCCCFAIELRFFVKGKRRLLYRNARTYEPDLRIGDDRIKISDTMKYLGVTFQTNFEFHRHIDQILIKVMKVFALYLNVLRRRGALSNEVRLLIYQQIIRPLMAYAFPVWYGISSSQMERLRVWERRILRSCRSPSL